MAKHSRRSQRSTVARSGTGPPAAGRDDHALRIIGGTLRGRRLAYTGDQRTRPMKDRVREAVFNLVGPAVTGMHAVDLFAGTGALGLEAISRGATRATFVEQHFPTAAVIRQNVAALGVADACEVIAADTFIWAKRIADLGPAPWLVFCSPPYSFYDDRLPDMLELVNGLVEQSPPGSMFVVEADDRFDFAHLAHAAEWDIRRYPPAVVGIYRKEHDSAGIP